MPDRVIIVDAHRAKENIPIYELKQMIGRTGRSSSNKDGIVDFIVGFNKSDDLKEDIKANEKFIVKSQLSNKLDNFIFYVIPYIADDLIKNKDDLLKQYEKTLDHFQGSKIEIDDVIDLLLEYETIRIENNEFKSTIIAKASLKYYIHPLKIHSWKLNFEEIFSNGEPSTFAYAWALSNVNQDDGYFSCRGLEEVKEEYSYQTSCYDNSDKCLKTGLCWWYLLGGPSIRHLKPIAKELKKQWNKIYSVLRILNKENKWGKSFILNDLNTRIVNRIDEELIKLCEVGFTKTSALELYHEYGITEFSEIKPRLNELLMSENQGFLDNLGKVLYERNIQESI